MADTEKYSAELWEDGTILVREGQEERLRLPLFDEFDNTEIYSRGDARPTMFVTENNRILVVGFGIGYLYFIRLPEGKMIKRMKLFPEVSYEDDSYLNIDVQDYYFLGPRLDFSRDGKYAVIRVRGEYDPQSGTGDFSPVFIRSFFLMDMETLEIVFSDDYSDIPDNGFLNLGVVAFSPDSRFLVTAAFGYTLKVFDLEQKRQVYCCGGVEWIPYSGAIDHRELAVFLDARTFVFVGKGDMEKERPGDIVKVQRQPDGSWATVQRIATVPLIKTCYSRRIQKDTIFDIEYEPERQELICYYDSGKNLKDALSYKV